jgi:hypothetical protein
MSESQARYQTGGTGRFVMYLVREDQSQMPLADITGATFMLIDGASRAKLNGRDAQDVWNGGPGAFGFQFDEAVDDQDNPVTRVGWDIELADVALGPDAYRGEHLGELTLTYAQGAATKTLRHVHRMRIIDAPLLCTFEDVSNYLQGLNPDRRELIEALIEAFAVRAQTYCRRSFRRQIGSEIFSPSDYQVAIRACRWPIYSTTDIREDFDGVFADPLTALDPADYFVNAAAGYAERRWGTWLMGAGTVQWTFDGGLCHGPEDAPGDLRECAAFQVADDYQNRDRSGVQSLSANQESISLEERWSLTKRSKQILDGYTRSASPT